MIAPSRTLLFLFAAATLGSLAGCTFGGPATGTAGRTSDVITEEEITESTLPTAYELVERIRPNWLRGRGSVDLRGGSPDLPVVYVAGVRQGGVGVLRSISLYSVAQMRFVDAPTATTRYGSGHGGGAIEVTVRRR